MLGLLAVDVVQGYADTSIMVQTMLALIFVWIQLDLTVSNRNVFFSNFISKLLTWEL